jgi:hypothetical protein
MGGTKKAACVGGCWGVAVGPMGFLRALCACLGGHQESHKGRRLLLVQGPPPFKFTECERGVMTQVVSAVIDLIRVVKHKKVVKL